MKFYGVGFKINSSVLIVFKIRNAKWDSFSIWLLVKQNMLVYIVNKRIAIHINHVKNYNNNKSAKQAAICTVPLNTGISICDANQMLILMANSDSH